MQFSSLFAHQKRCSDSGSESDGDEERSSSGAARLARSSLDSSDDEEDEDSATEAECNAEPTKAERTRKSNAFHAPPVDAPEARFALDGDRTAPNVLRDSPDSVQFSRSSVGGSKYLGNVCVNANANGSSDDLVFEARFESGNLAKVIKVTPVYYELYLRPDLYTNKHTQWFYFRVANTRKNVPYRFVELIGFRTISRHSDNEPFILLRPSLAQILHRELGEVGQPVHGGHAAADVFDDRCQGVCRRMETMR